MNGAFKKKKKKNPYVPRFTLDGSRQGLVIMNAEFVAQRYIKSWFILDLVTGIPVTSLSLLAGNYEAPGNVLQIAKMLKLLRVLRLIKIFKLNLVGTKLDDIYIDLMVFSSFFKYYFIIHSNLLYVALLTKLYVFSPCINVKISHRSIIYFMRFVRMSFFGLFVLHYISCG